MEQKALFTTRRERVTGPQAAPGWHAWYWPVREGTTRPGDDRPGPRSDDGRTEPGGRCRPGGTLLWSRAGRNPAEHLQVLGQGYETAAGTPTALDAGVIAGVFGREWLEHGRGSDDDAIRGPVRRHALERIRQFVACARASDPEREWTGADPEEAPLRTAYGDEGNEVRIEATAPHHGDAWPRTARLQLRHGDAPEITITALGTGPTRVELGVTPLTVPVADLPMAVAVAVNDAAGLRPPAPRLETLARAGRVIAAEQVGEIVLTRAEGSGYASPARTTREWLIETLQGYAVPREQPGGDGYGHKRPWEIDVRCVDGPGVLQGGTGSVRLTTARGHAALDGDDAEAVENAMEALRTRCGADRFWTDGRTPAVETIEGPWRTGTAARGARG